jgi:DNA invertase Pin-like site-specific DNA recombinase
LIGRATIVEEPEPDIVAELLRMVAAMSPGLLPEHLAQVEQAMRTEYGGLRVRIPKRAKYLTPEQRQALFKDGLTNMSTPQIIAKHKISRATLYREMKKGGRFD